MPFCQKGEVGASPTIRSTNWKTARVFLKKWHYLGDIMPAGILAIYGFWDYELAGIAVFTNSRCRVYDKMKMWELARFALRDDLPKNTESWLLSRLIKKFVNLQIILLLILIQKLGIRE